MLLFIWIRTVCWEIFIAILWPKCISMIWSSLVRYMGMNIEKRRWTKKPKFHLSTFFDIHPHISDQRQIYFSIQKQIPFHIVSKTVKVSHWAHAHGYLLIQSNPIRLFILIQTSTMKNYLFLEYFPIFELNPQN